MEVGDMFTFRAATRDKDGYVITKTFAGKIVDESFDGTLFEIVFSASNNRNSGMTQTIPKSLAHSEFKKI